MSRVLIRSIDRAIPAIAEESLGSKVHVGRAIGASDGECLGHVELSDEPIPVFGQ
jgi:hypothetical protein